MTSSSFNTDHSNQTTSSHRARLVKDLDACATRLQKGDLVAFPTETVYGLGCHALDELACQKVFAAKERPLTDPLIAHVLDYDQALKLWDNDNTGILRTLTTRFWPGPLTLVAPAASHVPGILTAHTHYVACRSPQHPVARLLIQKAGLPVAAPSANKFGHVSPTTAQHVFHDLKDEDVWIIVDDDNAACQVGVESTVAKLEGKEVIVLRQGAVAVAELQACLQEAAFDDIRVTRKSRHDNTSLPQSSPGQLIKHYAPHLPTYMVSEKCYEAWQAYDLSRAVVVDYGQRLVQWKETCGAYVDLSPSSNSSQAAQQLFTTLRWAELVPNMSYILVPQIIDDGDDALTHALQDRLTRAASGVVLDSLQPLLTKHEATNESSAAANFC